MSSIEQRVDALADETTFSGVVRIDQGDDVVLAKAYGLAHRALGVANTVDTCFGIASGTKGLTAAAVVSLIGDGTLQLSTTARSVLGSDLPLVDDAVTVEQLLAHRSGIGDFVDEDEIHDVNDHVLPVSVHELATTEDYLTVLDGHPSKFSPGERFAYCNSGYVLLALMAERTSGVAFHTLVSERVTEPAAMADTAFLRADALPGRAALGYLDTDGARTNVFHLPVRGSGDGGIYSTVADIRSFWLAFFGGRIVAPNWVAEMVRSRGATQDEPMHYGLGFWLQESRSGAQLTGSDAGVSFGSVHDPERRLTYTVVSNISDGAWPIVRLLDEHLHAE